MFRMTDRQILSWPRAPGLCLLFFSLLVARPCEAGGPPPYIFFQPSSLTVPILDSATFQVFAFSGTTMSYQWLKNGTNISGANLRSYTIASVQATDQATYSVKVSNAGGSVTSSGATLTVLFPPAITTQPQSQAVVQGQNASFSVAVNGSAPFLYQWNFNGASLSGATNSGLTRTNAQTTNAGSYTVVVTNSWGSVTSAVAALTVNVPPGAGVYAHSQT